MVNDAVPDSVAPVIVKLPLFATATEVSTLPALVEAANVYPVTAAAVPVPLEFVLFRCPANVEFTSPTTRHNEGLLQLNNFSYLIFFSSVIRLFFAELVCSALSIFFSL